MPSARRAAKAAAWAAPVISGLAVPPELRDPDHPLWHHQLDYRRFMDRRGWSMPPKER